MKKVFYLSTCSTCQRILNELNNLIDGFELMDIKTNPMSLDEIDHMKELSGSYESLFSRKAMKYRSMGLADKDLNESDYRELIHQEYTFLKRPVFIVEDKIFIGNAKKTIEALKVKLS